MPNPATTYGSYLAIDELLALQRPRSDGPEHDEMLFIVIHQVYELWFKEILHEIDYIIGLLDRGEAHRAQHSLKRVLTILKVLVAQIDILETMTPVEFLSFRARLDEASGFQSDQFRQLEFVLGRKSEAALSRFPEGSRARAALSRRFEAPTLWDAFVGYLARTGYDVASDTALRESLVALYRGDARILELCERLVDLDEGIQEWRYRHVKMVERTIGAKPGTGGSSGAAYLKTTLMQPLFPALWAIRGAL
jgi:tryptophan 2,3-dioxygenase